MCKCDTLYHMSDSHTLYSTLESARKLKFAPFCSSWDALSDGLKDMEGEI